MKKLSLPVLGAASALSAAITASSCGIFQPTKDPNALAMQVPLEQPSSAINKTEDAGASIKTTYPPEPIKISISTRQDLSAICAELEKGDFHGQCAGEIFMNNSRNDSGVAQFTQIRSRCLALLMACEKENKSSR